MRILSLEFDTCDGLEPPMYEAHKSCCEVSAIQEPCQKLIKTIAWGRVFVITSHLLVPRKRIFWDINEAAKWYVEGTRGAKIFLQQMSCIETNAQDTLKNICLRGFAFWEHLSV